MPRWGVSSPLVKIIDQLSPRSAHEHRIHRRPLPRQTEISTARRTIVMVAMALGAFAIGTTEFVSMGLLPLIAEDFGVSEDTASTLITTYALGVVVGAHIEVRTPAGRGVVPLTDAVRAFRVRETVSASGLVRISAPKPPAIARGSRRKRSIG